MVTTIMTQSQLALDLQERPRWGGRRRGAGRKRTPGRRPGVPHRRRLAHRANQPVLVTLRASREVASLREPVTFRAIQSALARASKDEFRVIEFSVQMDHVHLIAEAQDARTLSCGMRGLATRVALAVNRALGRRGRLWSDRYHARALSTPRAVRAALVYVLANVRKHLRVASGLDPCSSAPAFDGFVDRSARRPRTRAFSFPRHVPGSCASAGVGTGSLDE